MIKNNLKSFIYWFLASIAAAILSLILFMIVVDPYWRFDLVSIKGFNYFKPRVAYKMRLTRAHQICKIHPSNIIIGSSKVELSADPNHVAWRNFPGKTYAAGAPSMGIEELYKTLQHAHYASNKLNVALIGLDFFMFNAHREKNIFKTTVLDFDSKRLITSEDGSCAKTFLYDLLEFIGPAGLKASIATVLEQEILPLSPLYYIDGLRDDAFLKHRQSMTGSRFMFRRQEKDYLQKKWRSGNLKRYCFAVDGGNSTLDTFREMVRFAYNKGIDLRFFITPEHARMALAIRESGLWPQFEEWKKEMVNILYEEAKHHHASPFVLWDFSGFNHITMEVIPSDSDMTPMHWYWEGAHYKRELGDIITSYVIGGEKIDKEDDFTILLTQKNIQRHLNTQRAKAKQYISKFPEEYNFIKKVVEETLDGDAAYCEDDTAQLIIAKEALKQGDILGFQQALQKAEITHYNEKLKSIKLDLPFLEGKFWSNFKKIQNGESIDFSSSRCKKLEDSANIKKEKNDFSGAVEDYTKAIEFCEYTSDIYIMRGSVYMEMGDYVQAIDDFEWALEADSLNPKAIFLMNQSKYLLGKNKK